jgi:histidinol phosphatase-like PHP family hydrolase/predicted MPP superfamily phosphohydrolase
MPDALDILVVSDLHYVNHTGMASRHAARQGEWGLLLMRKALHRLRLLGIRPGLVVVLGDLVDDGLAAGADKDFAELAAALKSMGVATLVVHGNHDGDTTSFEALFGAPGLHVIGGYGFLVMNDRMASGDFTTRQATDLALVDHLATERPDLPLVVLQHNPMYPAVEDGGTYPYMLTNGSEALAGYDRGKVLLSLSGHYHAGQPRARFGEQTTCYTVPALCELPFAFAHVRLTGRDVEIREHHLKLEAPGLTDVHCHTQYAYCATTVSAKTCLQVSRLLGVGRVCLTEHAFHLYFDRDAAWSYRWQTDAAMVREAWRSRAGRMDEYKRFVAGFCGVDVRLGLEVDLCADGKLLLAPEDAEGWDLLVGAIHAIPGYVRGQTTVAETERLFLRETERLLACPIQVLAHPFRFFLREHLEVPTHLYPIVAGLLARHGVAGEVNFHTNRPDAGFVRECVRRGAKIALGTDGHDIVETGEFVPHLRVLEEAGIGKAELESVLYPIFRTGDDSLKVDAGVPTGV